ncbi:hypothetical protein RJ639_003388, partial [Escallonia herrerae]
VFLPDLCQRQRTNPHRAMIELLSSGAAAAAAGPASVGSSQYVSAAPAPAYI